MRDCWCERLFICIGDRVGLGEERCDICLCQYAAERDSVEAQTSYNIDCAFSSCVC